MSRRPIVLPLPIGEPMLPPPAREPPTAEPVPPAGEIAISNMNLTNKYPYVPLSERPQPSHQQVWQWIWHLAGGDNNKVEYKQMLRKTGLDRQFLKSLSYDEWDGTNEFEYDQDWYRQNTTLRQEPSESSTYRSPPPPEGDGLLHQSAVCENNPQDPSCFTTHFGEGDQKLVMGYGKTAGVMYPQGIEKCRFFKFKQGDADWRTGVECIKTSMAKGIGTSRSPTDIFNERTTND